jgi:hypothetical protein
MALADPEFLLEPGWSWQTGVGCDSYDVAREYTAHDGVQGLMPAAASNDTGVAQQSIWIQAWNDKGMASSVRLLRRLKHPRAAEFEAVAERSGTSSETLFGRRPRTRRRGRIPTARRTRSAEEVRRSRQPVAAPRGVRQRCLDRSVGRPAFCQGPAHAFVRRVLPGRPDTRIFDPHHTDWTASSPTG